MSRRPPPGGADPVTDTRSRGLVLLVAALVVGIFVLDKTQATPTTVKSTTTTTAPRRSRSTTTTIPPTTMRPARPPGQVKVLPANGSGVAGLGAKVAQRLKAANYNVLAATNTASGKTITTSVVEYAADLAPEALAVAQALGLPPSAVQPLEASPPLSDTKGADVIVLIGPDLNASTGATTTTARPATTSTTRA